jgi:hypothetical protein
VASNEKLHPWDLAAADLVHWLETEPDYYVEALKGGYRAPFSAAVSEAQKLDYYRRQAFMQNQDGTPDYGRPNQQGRDMLLQRLGTAGYSQVMSAVMPKKGLAPVEDPNAPDAYSEDRMQQEREQEAFGA